MIKNKKGMTTIELLICFTIVGIITASMFSLVMNYKEKQQVESIRGDVLSYKYSLTKRIQDDLIKNSVSGVKEMSSNSITIQFTDGESATLTVLGNGVSYSSKSMTKKPIFYPLPEIPNLKIQSIPYFIDDTTSRFLTIKIPFTHPDLDNREYGIFVVRPY